MSSRGEPLPLSQRTDSLTFQNLSAITPVVRFISQLRRTIRTGLVTREVLQLYDDYFRAIMDSFPSFLHVNAEGHLHASSLLPALCLQITRFLLYRQNLSPAAAPEDRVAAINRCASVALDTISYINRTFQISPMSPVDTLGGQTAQENSWHARIAASATSILCTHLWRCTLVLCFRGDYSSARVCTRVSSAIGSSRKVNIACGRNLAFFLDRLMERIHNGNGSQEQLDRDEEMLAYVAGDIQSLPEAAWIWTDAETESARTTPTQSMDLTDSSHPGLKESPSQYSMRSSGLLTDSERRDWGGWTRVEHLINQLQEMKASGYGLSPKPPQHLQNQTYPHGSLQRPYDSSSPRPTANGRPVSGSSTKMRIADLI